jgi:hypothetical protein
MLSGAGGGFSITVLERKDRGHRGAGEAPARHAGRQALTELHPVLSFVQLLTDVTDPLSYAPHWSSRATPPSLLVTSGERDEATPWRTAQAMALAGGLPIVAPVVLPIPGWETAGLAPIDAPVAANVGAATQGFLQWTDDVPGDDAAHWLVFTGPGDPRLDALPAEQRRGAPSSSATQPPTR